MSSKLSASEVMTSNVIVANTTTPFNQIIEFFDLYGIQHLPVAENDRLIGIVSVTDILRFLSKKLQSGNAMNLASITAQFNIKDVMTLDPISVSPDADYKEAIAILAQGKFQSVPVVKDGLILGIITNKDVVRNCENNE